MPMKLSAASMKMARGMPKVDDDDQGTEAVRQQMANHDVAVAWRRERAAMTNSCSRRVQDLAANERASLGQLTRPMMNEEPEQPAAGGVAQQNDEQQRREKRRRGRSAA